jgi:MFS family permease
MIACGINALMAGLNPRYLFLVGIAPALVVFWIRKKVPEPVEWQNARADAGNESPSAMDLFKVPVRRTTLLVIGVCALSLTAWWAFLFWDLTYLKNLPEFKNTFNRVTSPEEWNAWNIHVNRMASLAFFLIIGVSVVGNFFAAWVARRMGYRNAVIVTFAGFFACFMICYGVPRGSSSLMFWMSAIGFFSGVFGLFTMYLPPLFPTLLRTTGAGFCYNVGRIAAAAGTVIFGLLANVGDFRIALLTVGFLFLPAILVTLFMPDLRDKPPQATSPQLQPISHSSGA